MPIRPTRSRDLAVHAAPVDEMALVADVRAGNVSAFTTLVRLHYASLCRFAEAYVHSDATAEEVVQDVFAALWRHRETWEVQSNVRRYLCGAVRNRALSLRRRRRLESDWTAAATRDHAMDASLSMATRNDGRDAAARIETEELALMVRAVVDQLPERCREAFVLSRDLGLTRAEVAAVMQTTVKTVEVQLGKALRAIRLRLTGHINL